MRSVIIISLLFLSALVNAQVSKIYQFDKDGRTLRIELITPSVFRVKYSSNRSFRPSQSLMLVNYAKGEVAAFVRSGNNFSEITTASLKIRVNEKDLLLSVYDLKGNSISSETLASAKDSVVNERTMQPDEHFFGFGERMDHLDRRHRKVKLDVGRGKGLPHITGAYNVLEANYCPVPFFMSTKGYGIFYHTAAPSEFDMGFTKKDRVRFNTQDNELDYFFLYGPAFTDLLNAYTDITGKAPLMSKYAYGLHAGTYSGGTWGYENLTSDQYVLALARKFKTMGIKVDLLWLDSTWRIFGEVGGKGATSFEWRETFKDPKGMFDSLYAMDYKMVGLHLRPRFDNGRKIRLLDTAQQLKHTYPEGNYAGEFVNFFDSASVNFWWEHGVMRVASIGAKFLKTDEGSAFGALANESEKVGPQGKDIPKLHNLFPLVYARAPFEKFQDYNKERGLNHTREGYAGIQRYPFIFAGDWPSEWQYFEPVIKAGLNIGLSGVGHWGHCMGGFEHPADPELYIRWVQFGMFSPIAMVFGMDHPGYKEPWSYGDEALKNFKLYDSLRYRLLPYIYSEAFHQYKTGTPLMSALVIHYKDDENVYNITDQYLFGRSMMVCPVTTKGAQTRTVYLPEGEWYDFWTRKHYHGRQYIQVLTPLDKLPIFVKSGAIIPEEDPGGIKLNIFPGSGTYDLFLDDERTLDYQQGKFELVTIRTTNEDGKQQVKISPTTRSIRY